MTNNYRMKCMLIITRAKHIWNPKIVILDKIKGLKPPSLLEWPTSLVNSQGEQTPNSMNKRIYNWFNIYENLIGLSEVKCAQNNVLTAEQSFLEALNVRKGRSREIEEVQREIRDIRDQLETTSRGQDKYLDLITREHQALRKEAGLSRTFKEAEEEERLTFQKLSSAVRESHEKERVQSEKTKYLSLMGSLLGILIGVVASGINNKIKMNQLKTLMIEGSNEKSLTPPQLTTTSTPLPGLKLLILSELTQALERERKRLETFLDDLKILLSLDLKETLKSATKTNGAHTNATLWKQLYDTMVMTSTPDDAKSLGRSFTTANENSEITTKSEALNRGQEVLGVNSSAEGMFTTKSALLLTALKESDEAVERDLQDIKAALALRDDKIHLTFVDKGQLKEILASNQKDLEWKLKMNSLATTVILYACIAITLPIFYSLSRG